MKVILKQDHEKLGKTGEAINVKDGFAMNYLIPNHIVMRVILVRIMQKVGYYIISLIMHQNMHDCLIFLSLSF